MACPRKEISHGEARRLRRERSGERCEHEGRPHIGSRSVAELMNSRARTGTTDGADHAPMAVEVAKENGHELSYHWAAGGALRPSVRPLGPGTGRARRRAPDRRWAHAWLSVPRQPHGFPRGRRTHPRQLRAPWGGFAVSHALRDLCPRGRYEI